MLSGRKHLTNYTNYRMNHNPDIVHIYTIERIIKIHLPLVIVCNFLTCGGRSKFISKIVGFASPNFETSP